MLHDVGAQINILIDTIWANKACAEKSIVPIKNDRRLVLLGFSHWCQPYFFVCESRKKILAQFVASTVSAHLIEAESLLSLLFRSFYRCSTCLDLYIPIHETPTIVFFLAISLLTNGNDVCDIKLLLLSLLVDLS